MTVEKFYLSENDYSRPCNKIREVLGLVIHWTANSSMDALHVRDFFEAKKSGMGGYGSAHYVIGQKGEIVQCIPESEIAYHCGSSAVDPASSRVYTDEARKRFGKYAIDYKTTSPNFCTLSIELCPIDRDGNFSQETIESAIALCADILSRYGLCENDITTHHDIVGWKDCPRLWTKNPCLLDAFRQDVKRRLSK